IGDQNEVANGIDDEPRGQGIAGPEMQKNRNQGDLLGNSQNRLEKVCRPPRKQPPPPAGPRGAHDPLPIKLQSMKSGFTSIKLPNSLGTRSHRATWSSCRGPREPHDTELPKTFSVTDCPCPN